MMKWLCSAVVLVVAIAAHAENPVTQFTDADGIPKLEYLEVKTCYGGAECHRTCDVLNSQDHSKMDCGAWVKRYCPPSLKSANCETFKD